MKRAYDALGLNVGNLVGQGNVLRAVPGGPRMTPPAQVAVSINASQQPTNMAPGNVNVRLLAPPQQGMFKPPCCLPMLKIVHVYNKI